MRMLLLAVTVVALVGGSYWALTSGPLAPGGGGVEGITAGLVAGAEALLDDDDGPAYDGQQAVYTRLEQAPYAVEGQTENELLQSMLARGPRAGETIFFGLTGTELDFRYDQVEVADGCMIRNARVFLDVRIILPQWAPPAGADPGLVADWARFRRALEAHEDEHRRIAVAGAERSHLAVAELLRPTCEEAIEEARRRLERIGVETSAVHRQFDAETAHGRSDGALWPLPD